MDINITHRVQKVAFTKSLFWKTAYQRIFNTSNNTKETRLKCNKQAIVKGFKEIIYKGNQNNVKMKFRER